MNNKFLLLFLAIFSTAYCNSTIIKTARDSKLYVCTNNSGCAENVIESLKTLHIDFEIIESVNSSDDHNLYIIFDVFNIDQTKLPKYYITYQTLDVNYHGLTPGYLDKLSKSVAVWDYSQQNITKYRSVLHNYLYFPAHYEFIDPVLLPCCLPTATLNAYKELLVYSNQKDTDISSHLPALFYHTLVQNPKVIVEAGVRGGESTKPLHKAIQFCDASLIGIDVIASAATAYRSLQNAIFIEMNDLDFDKYYRESFFKHQKIDVIFIDTSHLYEHTLQEITLFAPLLSEKGALAFHDSNVTPLPNAGYIRLNDTKDYAGGNTRGVTQAIKEYFSLVFDEYKYCNMTFMKDGTTWHLTHYPFCNGLTIIRKVETN